jgi:hypothetical protein
VPNLAGFGLDKVFLSMDPSMTPPKKLRWQPGEWSVDNPGLFRVSDEMLRRLRPDCYGLGAWLFQKFTDVTRTLSFRDLIKEHLWLGSIQAALVMSLQPGRVAAYSDMLDCVALLDYPPRFLEDFQLRRGDRLLTVNMYHQSGPQRDLVYGPGKCSDWTGFQPIIADFVSDDEARLEERKTALPEENWQRAWGLGVDYVRRWPDRCRSGEPHAMLK